MNKRVIACLAGAAAVALTAIGLPDSLSPIGQAHADKGGGGGGGGSGSSGSSGHGSRGGDSSGSGSGSGRGGEGEGARGKSADAPGQTVSAVARDKSLDDGPHGTTVSSAAKSLNPKSETEARGRTAEGEAPRGSDPK